jgi:hemoglobin-like flavoprotein
MIAFLHDESVDKAIIGRRSGAINATERDEMKLARNKATTPPAPPVNRSRQVATRVSAKQIQLLRKSFALIEPQAAIAGLIFYRNLFTLDPSLKSMFHTSIELQGRKLMEALNYTIATIEDPAMLVPVLEGLGRRHVSYGVKDIHYVAVIAAFLETLAEVLGTGCTSPVCDAWKAALAFVADTMKRGASQTAIFNS